MSSTTPQRATTRALLGTMALVVLMLVYVFAAMLLAVAVLPGAGHFAEFSFYAVAGLAWVPLAVIVIKWMYPPNAKTGVPQ